MEYKLYIIQLDSIIIPLFKFHCGGLFINLTIMDPCILIQIL